MSSLTLYHVQLDLLNMQLTSFFLSCLTGKETCRRQIYGSAETVGGSARDVEVGEGGT